MPEEAAVVVTPELPASRVVVTSENRAEYMAKRLDIAAPVEAKPDSEAKAEPEKAEPSPEKKDEAKEEKKHPIKERMGELAAARDAARADAAKEKERAEKAERELSDLRGKNAPKPEIDAKPAPKREDFADDQAYEDARIDWRADQRIAEREKKAEEATAKAEQDQLIAAWQEQLDDIKKEIPDYDERINAAKVQVRNYVRDAIVDSAVGVRVLLHLADNQADAERIAKMSAMRAVKEIGKLEDRFAKKIEKEVAKKEEAKPEVKKEISKAPAPIEPLKGAAAPAGDYLDGQGNFKGDYAQYKALRKAGKIK